VPRLPIALSCLLSLAIVVPLYGQHPAAPCPWESERACRPRTWNQRWSAFWYDVELQRRRVAEWPRPFLEPDREAVRETFRHMTESGWQQQNTFGDPLFATDQKTLNLAGQHQLRYTITQLPPHRRMVFVLEGATREITEARVASVYEHMSEVLQERPPYPVFVTSTAPRGMRWEPAADRTSDSSANPRLLPPEEDE